MSECVFCRIIAGEAPAQIATRGDGVLAFHPIDPVTEGHLLVVPTEHVVHFMHKPEVTGRVAEFAARIANHWMGGGDTNLITSAGGYATQTVQHLHFHIVPRSLDDGLLLPWSGLEVTEALDACREQRTDLAELVADLQERTAPASPPAADTTEGGEGR